MYGCNFQVQITDNVLLSNCKGPIIFALIIQKIQQAPEYEISD